MRSWAERELPLPEVGYELQDGRGGSVPRRNWHGPQRRSPPCSPRGSTQRPEFEKRGWKVFDATDLAARKRNCGRSWGRDADADRRHRRLSSSTPSPGIPRAQQKKVREFTEKFQADPKSTAINYEKIYSGQETHKVRTVRIDQKYRAVVLHPEQGDVYVLMWVDNHDEAMDWAKRTGSSRSTPAPGRCRSSASAR